MVKSMADKPIIFAMANPDPEITPEDVALGAQATPSSPPAAATIANQINNVLGFPYIFRGALDVRARTINEEMKVAAAEALAKLAREDVPDEVDRAYSGRRLRYGPEYVMPVPFDPRLISTVSAAVAQAAMDSGVARRPIPDMAEYRRALAGRLDPTSHWLQSLFEQVKANPQRIVFAEGEEERTIRAAVVFRDNGYGTPILIGREELVRETMKGLGITDTTGMEIHNARLSTRNAPYTDLIYKRLQRDGYLRRDVQRMVNQGRNVFGASMVAMGDAAGMVTGITRRFPECYGDITNVIDEEPGKVPIGYSIVVARHGTVFLADTSINETPIARAARHHRQADGAATPAPWATSRAWRSSPSPTSAAARSSASTASARRSGCSTPRRSTSSTTARCRPTWRSTTSCCARPIRSAA